MQRKKVGNNFETVVPTHMSSTQRGQRPKQRQENQHRDLFLHARQGNVE